MFRHFLWRILFFGDLPLRNTVTTKLRIASVSKFSLAHLTIAILRLPGWSADPFDSMRVLEDGSDVFETLACSLGEHEEYVDKHGNAEDTKDDVCAPLNIDKCGRDEVSESEVESLHRD